MATTPEGKVKAAVRKALAARGVVAFSDVLSGRAAATRGVYYMPVAGRFSILGIHDFVGVWDSVFFSIETKAPNNREDERFHQGKFREAVTSAGGIALTGVRDAESAVAHIERRVQEITSGRVVL